MKQLKDTSITVRLSVAMKEAVQRAATAERRSLSQMVAVAMEQFLESRGEWPPARARNKTTRRR